MTRTESASKAEQKEARITERLTGVLGPSSRPYVAPIASLVGRLGPGYEAMLAVEVGDAHRRGNLAYDPLLDYTSDALAEEFAGAARDQGLVIEHKTVRESVYAMLKRAYELGAVDRN